MKRGKLYANMIYKVQGEIIENHFFKDKKLITKEEYITETLFAPEGVQIWERALGYNCLEDFDKHFKINENHKKTGKLSEDDYNFIQSKVQDLVLNLSPGILKDINHLL